jgi:3-oxo-5alpha-steroid 4-dehydrogenase
MAQAVGADLGRMDGCEVSVPVPAGFLCRGIVVNRLGQRFVTEDTYPGLVGHAIRFKADDAAFLLLDQESFESTPEISESPVRGRDARAGNEPPTWVSDSLAELAQLSGIPLEQLQFTVESFNSHAENGQDPAFHKGHEWIKPLRPPYGLFDMSHPPRAFSLGGLRIDTSGRVLHVSGEPIPGLYAAGRAASGIPVAGYASGTSLGDGVFFGRRAGAAAVLDTRD